MSRNQASYLTRCYRFCRLFVHVVYAVLLVAFFYPHFSKARRALFVKRWSLTLLGILNVRLKVKGEQHPAKPANSMLAANHVSWLDIFILYTQYYTRFVAKAEMRTWPVIGWLSMKVGTLFIERVRRRDTARINQRISQALLGGDCIAVFPEGTTSDGTYLQAFHSSLLEPAVISQSTLYPVALRYPNLNGAVNTEVAYADKTTLISSLLKILAQREILAELIFAKPIPAQGKNRRELARAAEAAIAGRLNLSVRH
ncbi:MAG: lysophospholipid acyltransferase family protein, partial [Burkholderiales bacterium]